jgi:hypothetical protein
MTTEARAIRKRLSFAASLVSVGCIAGACGNDTPTPTAPTTAPSPPAVSLPAPTILSVTPSLGSTGGGASIMITGTGLQPGIQVTLGSMTVSARFDPRYRDRIFLTTPSHAAGLVDVVVTNPDRQTGLATGAYTFASPDSFDVNGDWQGGVFTGHEPFTITVVGGSVVSISCWTSGSVTLSPPAPIRNGEISFSGDDGVAISGRILSPTEAEGRVTVGPCVGADWYAVKE